MTGKRDDGAAGALVECVPNFSEGRRPEVVEAIAEAIRKTRGVRVLNVSRDEDHNRSVITFLGPPQAVQHAILAATGVAVEHINLEEHQGAHPRIGAVDVVPFIPIRGCTMEECVQWAREAGEAIHQQYRIPIYFYEAAALRPERRNLAHIRKGNYEGLKADFHNPDRRPDLGDALHPTAGATVVGARKPLIAYNINLNTPDVSIAKAIAKRIRAKDGGLANVKAMGVALEERGLAQVSMNLVDYQQTALYTVFELVSAEAARYGVSIRESEIVGLVPMEALVAAAQDYLRLAGFSANQVLETHLLPR